MDKLAIAGTKSTPEVLFDPVTGKLSLTGQSYPENAFKFYEPLLHWLDEYLVDMQSDTVLSIMLHLPYINTSSTKCFMMLLEKLDGAFLSGKNISIEWHYNADNESELECAEEFQEDLSLPFQLIAKEDRE
ncbi:DUF1987 domain-containing protein [Paenibacillus sepulcri]|uniref:DUF1987 domain-containing protein n=1 Tax=Paenibacillus sepulcri TaxID=359917 RepID=A0ABS7C6Q6_9BACL|nr:DUF1987 domain-containing protein [Paenibacillus sepulcri]